jgi:hypothetical protein
MQEFRIDEISAVDYPAQEPAIAAILKGVNGYEELTPVSLTDDTPRAFDTFEEAVTYLKAHGGSGTAAMSQARRQYPALLAKLQAPRVSKTDYATKVERRLRSDAKQKFDLLVGDITARRKVPRHVAMRIARQENPQAYAALNA